MLLARPSAVVADVVVLANRTQREIQVQINRQGARPAPMLLSSGRVKPLFSDQPIRLTYLSDRETVTTQLEPNAAYFFGEDVSGEVALQQIGLGRDESTGNGRKLPAEEQASGGDEITVALYVDEENALRKPIWQQTLRRRLQAASNIIEAHSGVRFRVVALGSWDSDDTVVEFTGSLTEFERETKRNDCRLHIGFTSQYELVRGRTHLGGTRGPMNSHILLREWSRHVTERERLELLVHELGHFLGASHSPEQDSVMRPVLGDRQSRRADFKIRFDPVNTLIISMVGEEIRRRGVNRFRELSVPTLVRLKQIYTELGKAFPDDDSTRRFKQLTTIRARVGKNQSHAAKILRGLSAAALANSQRSSAARLSGDALFKRYVQQAAEIATELPAESRSKTFLMALGIAWDSTGELHNIPQVRRTVSDAETGAEKERRLSIWGNPTLRDRSDLAKHFCVAAHLTAAIGPEAADKLGLAKEVLDAQGGTGLSFADVAANRAGIRFANKVLASPASLARIAENFEPEFYMPAVAGLPEGLQQTQLKAEYGGLGDERFERQLQAIEERLDGLPPYMTFDLQL